MFDIVAVPKNKYRLKRFVPSWEIRRATADAIDFRCRRICNPSSLCPQIAAAAAAQQQPTTETAARASSTSSWCRRWHWEAESVIVTPEARNVPSKRRRLPHTIIQRKPTTRSMQASILLAVFPSRFTSDRQLIDFLRHNLSRNHTTSNKVAR